MTNEKKYQEPHFQTQKVYIDGDIHPIKVAMRNHIGRYKNVKAASKKSANYYLRYFGTVH
jgi:hypothetical protein